MFGTSHATRTLIERKCELRLIQPSWIIRIWNSLTIFTTLIRILCTGIICSIIEYHGEKIRGALRGAKLAWCLPVRTLDWLILVIINQRTRIGGVQNGRTWYKVINVRIFSSGRVFFLLRFGNKRSNLILNISKKLGIIRLFDYFLLFFVFNIFFNQ